MNPIAEIDSYNIIKPKPNNQHLEFVDPTAGDLRNL